MSLNNKSRTINASKNAISAIANKLIILVLTFVSRRVFIKYIGIEYLGINGLFANVLTLLSMADLGLGTAMNVNLYKPIAENNTEQISALLNYFKKIYRFIAVGITVVGMALMPFLPYLVNMDQDIPHLRLYYLVFVLKNTVSYLLIYKSSLLYADQKNYVINRIDAIVNIARVIVQIIAIVLFKNYFCFILLEVVTVLIKNIIVSLRVDHEYKFLNKDNNLNLLEKKAIFSDVSSIFLYKIAWSLLNGTDNILMSIIVGTIYVGYYSNYYTITSSIELFIGLLFTSLTASIGNLVATCEAKKRYEVFEVMQMVSFWICGFTVVSLLFLTQDFIVIWLGKDFLLSDITMIAIALNVFFSTCMRPVWTFREGTGMYKQIRYIMFVTAILNLILSVILGKLIGISGILFATSISKLLTYFWYEPNILFRNFFNESVKHYYLSYLKNFVLIGICIGLCYCSLHFITTISITSWIIKVIIIAVIVNIVYYLTYRKTGAFKMLFDKLHILRR